MGTQPGWYEDATDPTQLRYWDGSAWTDHFTPKPPTATDGRRGAPTRSGAPSVIPKEQVAHDLAIAYINNKYGAEVTGTFSVTSSTDYESNTVRDVAGEGTVVTEFLPDLDTPETVRVGTGERHLFGIGPEKTRLEPTGRYEVDAHLMSMIRDYYRAYERILELLDRR
jgi:hypothetical protein